MVKEMQTCKKRQSKGISYTKIKTSFISSVQRMRSYDESCVKAQAVKVPVASINKGVRLPGYIESWHGLGWKGP